MRKVLGAGAEATVYLDGKIVDKERSVKNYRHADIDSTLRKTRTRKEAKILRSLERYGIAPKIIEQKEYDIIMEHVVGIQLKRLLDKDPKLAFLIGKNLSIMHDLNIIHGDLTTSNMILTGKSDKDTFSAKSQDKSKKLYFIDFGLSFNSSRIEDKAVDIHLFKQALESKHFRVNDKAYRHFLKGYDPKDKKEILERLDIVETRGRYKEKT